MNPILALWPRLAAVALLALAACAAPPAAQIPPPPQIAEPAIGTPGKDVVYVPQPAEVVDKMMEVGQVGPQDFVIDLGSGDGRNVIAAAKRGARALGVEFNPEFVEYSKRAAAAAGVANRASFVQGDMYEADISQATVLALFLLTDNLTKLRPKFLALKPGTRIVSNTFKISDWEPDESVLPSTDCSLFCQLHLYIVPAQVGGRWRLGQGELALEQKFQMLSGRLNTGGASLPLEKASLRGDRIRFSAGGVDYEGRVSGESMEGSMQGKASGSWSARRSGS